MNKLYQVRDILKENGLEDEAYQLIFILAEAKTLIKTKREYDSDFALKLLNRINSILGEDLEKTKGPSK
jgi:hypothetical protein